MLAPNFQAMPRQALLSFEQALHDVQQSTDSSQPEHAAAAMLSKQCCDEIARRTLVSVMIRRVQQVAA